jgi:hypothetical protein
MGLQKLGAERRRQKAHRSVPLPEPLANAQHHNLRNVMEQHISNDSVREKRKSYAIKQTMELRLTRWLEKISHMGADRGPRKILVAWTTNERPCGRPQQTIQHGLAATLTYHLNLHSPKMNDWIKLASDHKKWGST